MRRDITLYFVRHGETDWNAERRYQGQRDIPLNARGRTQAKRNGEVLKHALVPAAEPTFVASSLARAKETMTIMLRELARPEAGFGIDDRLRELSYGEWEGKLETELPHLDPEGVAARTRDPLSWRPPGGESYADLLLRTAAWADSLECDTVAASHGGVSRCLRAYVLGLDPATIPTLESPQDRVLVLNDGHMRWL